MFRKWLGLLLAAGLLITACSKDDAGSSSQAGLSGGFLQVSSDAFQEGGQIPVEYTCDGKNINPTIQWTKVPEKTKSIALIMFDPDAPGGTFTHWVIYNIPPIIISLLSGLPNDDQAFAQGKNSFGDVGYGGPCPPKGQEHRYYFVVTALDVEQIPIELDSAGLQKAMQGHILAQGRLTGKYKH
jgi:Raf kinase inhibitor-like YbhB/YbcL family protein